MTNGAHVLIVDDDTALLQALPEALRLRMRQIEVDVSDSATRALERISATDYDAIITDIKMPGMDGLALLTEIRSIRPDTPTLLITGHGEHDLALQALRGGAYDFIQKPIDRDYFVASLARAIQMRQLSRRIDRQQQDLERHAADLEKAVEERTRELREANRAKDQFLALLAHELRNPLAPILNAVGMMRFSEGGDPILQQARDVIERQVRHMARLLEDLLDVSRISCGKVELRKQRLDLVTVINRTLQTVRPFLESRGHRLRLSIPTEQIPVEADSTRIEQVLSNLLNNAAKYTPSGGRIELKAEVDGDTAIVSVRDSGIGIAPEILPRIFDPFVQADQSLDRSEGGLGIGLSLAKSLVEMHGGTVRADSQGPGTGSEFVVRLPLDPSGRQDPDAGHGSVGDAGLPMASKRIVVVEDNQDSRQTLRTLLRMMGHKVETAADGHEGVEKVLHWRPEIAFVDIGLPGLDGYEVAKQVRSLLGDQGPNLVALTGYGHPEDRRRALDAGFNAHLVKPINVDELKQLLSD